jgi:2'-5' RNA ligase
MSASPSGIFVLAPLSGPLAERVREINERYDPKLARGKPPHVTLAGSSGVGPIPPNVEVEEVLRCLEPVAASAVPLSLPLKPAICFMQTDIIVLPLSPHGPLRELHDRIATCGLPFMRPRFTFSPHVTLSLYQTLTPEAKRELLATRIDEPCVIDRFEVYHTRDPLPARKLFELPFGGAMVAGGQTDRA